MSEIAFEKRPDDVIAEVLSRYTVMDLIEQTDTDLDAGEDKLYKAEQFARIIDQGETNLIRWWKIDSGGKVYEARRFENFCFCSCKDFFFTKKVCKHLTLTTRFFCNRCHKREAQFGRQCGACDQDTAPYLKPASTKSPERIGNIRI